MSTFCVVVCHYDVSVAIDPHACTPMFMLLDNTDQQVTIEFYDFCRNSNILLLTLS